MKRFLYLKIFAVLLLCIFGPAMASAESTALFFNAPARQVQEGERVNIDVKISSPLQSINAVSGVITFPDSLLRVISISKDKSVINFWTKDPAVQRNQISFEGVALNPGFKGSSGLVFRITFQAKREGTVMLKFSEGSILANDGQGTNILASLGFATFRILPGMVLPDNSNPTTDNNGNTSQSEQNNRLLALPVITDYSPSIESKDGFYLKGKGEPSALTKIVFRDVSVKSLGEQLITFLQNDKKKLDEVLVKNDAGGAFEYTSLKNLVAGVYNATPFLVDHDTNTEKPGFGVQLFVSDSQIVKALIVLLNVLGLLIPIVLLGTVIYFIPWYSWRRMRVLKKKLGLEEEKIELSGHQLERQDKILDKNIGAITDAERPT
jgi:hypothetical protein